MCSNSLFKIPAGKECALCDIIMEGSEKYSWLIEKVKALERQVEEAKRENTSSPHEKSMTPDPYLAHPPYYQYGANPQQYPTIPQYGMPPQMYPQMAMPMMPGQMPSHMPSQMHMSGQIPPGMSGQLPPHMPGQMSPHMSGQMPPHMAGHMPPHMSGQMPPYMASGQMPPYMSSGQMPPYMPGASPQIPMGYVPSVPFMPPNLGGVHGSMPPDQVKSMLLKQAQMLEEAAQGARNEQSVAQQIEFYTRENAQLAEEIERLKNRKRNDNSNVRQEINDLKSELVRSNKAYDSLTTQLASSNEHIRSLEDEIKRKTDQDFRRRSEPERPKYEERNFRKSEEHEMYESFERPTTRPMSTSLKSGISPAQTQPEGTYIPVRTQVNVSHNVSQILNWEEPPPFPSQNPTREENKIVESIREKLAGLETEKSSIQRELERTRGNLDKQNDLELQLDILNSNIDRLNMKIKKYSS